jgi:hypothetical protein
VLGIGGGGDIVGALAVARLCESLGTEAVLGGVAWERIVVDPQPGPRPLSQITGGRSPGPGALIADGNTRTEDGVDLCEGLMAAHLGTETVLVDVSLGAPTAARGIVAAAGELDCDLVVYVDVGGDVLARGDEPGLASPLCDAVMVAAAVAAAPRVPGIGAVFGPGCDGELTADEVLERVAALARAGAWLGSWSMPPEVADEVEAAARAVPTEASLQAVRCARGETGDTPIRGGRRTVRLGPVGALTLFFDLEVAFGMDDSLASVVSGRDGIESARLALAGRGIRTELDYERERAAEAASQRD